MEYLIQTPTPTRRSSRLSSRASNVVVSKTAHSGGSPHGFPTPSPMEYPTPSASSHKPSTPSPLTSVPTVARTSALSVNTFPVEADTIVIHGLTSITVQAAEQRSQPNPGEHLTDLVKKARSSGQISRAYNLKIVRLVDGKWMVPQKCKK